MTNIIEKRGLRAEWLRLARVLTDPAVELDSDEFAALYSTYMRMKRAGVAIDPMAEALILQGAYGLIVDITGNPAIESGWLSREEVTSVRALPVDDVDVTDRFTEGGPLSDDDDIGGSLA